MEDLLLFSNLFDYYGCLLTEKQIKYFEDYYFNNLTLGEISENDNVSRNAVHKSLKEATDKLLYYEEKLKLYEKNKEIKKIINKIDDKKLQNELNELI